jgi:hypothetical protein
MEYTLIINENMIVLAVLAIALIFFGAYGLGFEMASIKFYRYLTEKNAKEIMQRNSKKVVK